MSFLMVQAVKLGVKQVQKKRHPGQHNHNVWYDTSNTNTNTNNYDYYDNYDMAEKTHAAPRGRRPGRPARPRRPYPAQPPKFYVNLTLRLFQFCLALAIVGMYGVDLHHASEQRVYADPKWVYAEWTSGISVITAGIHLVSLWYLERRRGASAAITSHAGTKLPFFVWEALLCVFWLVLFGIFGKMYISEDAEGQEGIARMKRAVWLDLINMFLWVATATGCGLRWWRGVTSKDAQTQVDEHVQTQVARHVQWDEEAQVDPREVQQEARQEARQETRQVSREELKAVHVPRQEPQEEPQEDPMEEID